MACVAGTGRGRDTCCVWVSSEQEAMMDSERKGARLEGWDPEEYIERDEAVLGFRKWPWRCGGGGMTEDPCGCGCGYDRERVL